MLGPFQVIKPSLTLQPKPAAGSQRDGPLLAWWKFDDGEGSIATNAAGAGFAGQLHGNPRWIAASDQRQGALDLDGVDDWIECRDGTDLGLHDGLTVSVWIKLRALPDGGATVVAKGDAWSLQLAGGTGELEFNLNGPRPGTMPGRTALRTAGKRPLSPNQWHHVVAVYDGKRAALYVNGVEESGLKASGAIVLNNLPLSFGQNLAERREPWNGLLDDLRLFDRGLTAGEIKSLYSQGL